MCDCSDLLSGSRTSRLYTQLVESGQAYHANAVPSYPGEKHPNALVLFGQPSSGVSLQTLDKAFQKETQGLIHNGPSAKEMARIKKVGQFELDVRLVPEQAHCDDDALLATLACLCCVCSTTVIACVHVRMHM